jgi:hypothetical protein
LPVLAAAFLMTRWFLNRAIAEHDKHTAQLKERYAELLREKDARIADRDKQIAELDEEVSELKAKLTRSPKKKEGDGGEP